MFITRSDHTSARPHPKRDAYDVIVVGAGPNGLASAITLAKEGLTVLLIEGGDTIGGGTRSLELTQPGFIHDICSAIHPLGIASPFFKEHILESNHLSWAHSPAPLAHPLDDGTAAMLERSTQDTGDSLATDAKNWSRLMDPLVADYQKILEDILGPLPLPPSHPLATVRFGLNALWPARLFANRRFQGTHAKALFAGMAAHSFLPLEKPVSAAFGLMLGLLGHAVGWPMAVGGSQRIAEALGRCLETYGGEIITGWEVSSLAELPPSRLLMMDITPRQLLSIAGDRLPSAYRRGLQNFRYGPGVFKVDWALSEPIPWEAQECRRAATVHIGGTMEEISASEAAAWKNEIIERPFVLLAQQSLFDPSRAPAGKHTAWGYCHVPHNSSADMLQRIENQIERFAPGFKDCILARSIHNSRDMVRYNPNYVGGDINGGTQDITQLFTRPLPRWVPYATPVKGLFLCSSSTPPGGGVHGMCGYKAARAALRTLK